MKNLVEKIDNLLTEIAHREDTDKEFGLHKYGNVKFADPKNKKYPIDTEKHIRAAWSYIHMPKNAAKYSSSDVAAIKKAIVRAWKAKVDANGPQKTEKEKE